VLTTFNLFALIYATGNNFSGIYKGDDYMINYNAPRMEGIETVAEMFNIPKYRVRQLALTGQVPAIKCGAKKILINVDGFAEYLNNAHIGTEQSKPGISALLDQLNRCLTVAEP